MYLRSNIIRLLQYRSCLTKFQELGFNTIYSYNLGKRVGVSAEQIRKDFSKFNIRGNKKAGYNIEELITTINEIFKKSSPQNVLLVGYGNIGQSLIKYKGFSRSMFYIKAAIDIDPSKHKRKAIVPVLPPEKAKEIIKKNGIKIGIIAVPDTGAQEMCDLLVKAGIKGILNFSSLVLKVPENVIINNINLGNELEALFYHIHSKQRSS
ncbi:Redox-sensing transcriptional repressor Rex [subsurface metagenome]